MSGRYPGPDCRVRMQGKRKVQGQGAGIKGQGQGAGIKGQGQGSGVKGPGHTQSQSTGARVMGRSKVRGQEPYQGPVSGARSEQ